MSVVRQENAVAPFTIGYCQNLRSRREAVRFSGQKRIWLGAEEVLVRRVARVPECGLIGFSHVALSRHPWNRDTHPAYRNLCLDRKSVVLGQRVQVSDDLGGLCLIKKKPNKTNKTHKKI